MRVRDAITRVVSAGQASAVKRSNNTPRQRVSVLSSLALNHCCYLESSWRLLYHLSPSRLFSRKNNYEIFSCAVSVVFWIFATMASNADGEMRSLNSSMSDCGSVNSLSKTSRAIACFAASNNFSFGTIWTASFNCPQIPRDGFPRPTRDNDILL